MEIIWHLSASNHAARTARSAVRNNGSIAQKLRTFGVQKLF